MSKNIDQDDRQTRLLCLDFERIDVINDYGITQRLNDVDNIKSLISRVLETCYNKDVNDKHDVDYIHKIDIQFSQPHNYDSVKIKDGPPSIKVKMELYTWETKNQMYNRRSFEKRERELKEAKLAQEAKLLGFKLEKVNHTPAATDEQCGHY